MNRISELPKSAQLIINQYRMLNLGGKNVQCPYFINTKRRKDLRAMVGKGTPVEILMESKIWEKLKGVNFDELDSKEIKEFLLNKGIGIDCSGFVLHVLNAWYRDRKGKDIWKDLKIYENNIMSRLRFFLRPAENMGANTLTGDINTKQIVINEVLPGDLIRSKWKKVGTHHVHLVYEVQRIDNKVKLIKYVHATPYYGEDSGVKFGEIEIIDQNNDLKDQKWNEIDSRGVNFSYEGFLNQVEDNGLRRLKIMEGIIEKE